MPRATQVPSISAPALPAAASAARASHAIDTVFDRFPAETFDRGAVLIENTFLQTGADRSRPMLAYVHEGLVRGAWNRSKLAPKNRATAIVVGDGRWVGADAFKYEENLFRYLALTETRASLVPMRWLRDEAPREVLLDALKSISLSWCTTATVLTLCGETLERRTLLLLFDLCRLHPRPELEVRQKDLADLLGVTRQTLHPVLKRLDAAGLVSLGYGEIVVGDAERLFEELRRSALAGTARREAPAAGPRGRRSEPPPRAD